MINHIAGVGKMDYSGWSRPMEKIRPWEIQDESDFPVNNAGKNN